MASFSATRWYYILYAGSITEFQLSALSTWNQNEVTIGVPTQDDTSYWWQFVPSESWTPSNLVYLLRNHDSGPEWYFDTYCYNHNKCDSSAAVTQMEVQSDNVDRPRTQWLIKASDPKAASKAWGTYQFFNEGNGTQWMLTCDNGFIELTNSSTAPGIYWTFLPANIISNSSFLGIPECANPSSPTYLHCSPGSGLSGTTKGLIALAIVLLAILGAAGALFWNYRGRKRKQIAKIRQSSAAKYNIRLNDNDLHHIDCVASPDAGVGLPDFAGVTNYSRRNSSALNSDRSMSRPPNLRDQRDSSSLVELASPSDPTFVTTRKSGPGAGVGDGVGNETT